MPRSLWRPSGRRRRGRGREFGRGDQRAAQLLGQALQAAGHVDRRADHGEVEPGRRADIAELDVAQMQGQAAAQRLLAARPPAAPPGPRSAASAASAAASARSQVAAGSPSIGNTASSPSPMNFRISPPPSAMAAPIASNQRLSTLISFARGSRSDRAVKPRRSQNQIAARIVRRSPRSIWPS